MTTLHLDVGVHALADSVGCWPRVHRANPAPATHGPARRSGPRQPQHRSNDGTCGCGHRRSRHSGSRPRHSCCGRCQPPAKQHGQRSPPRERGPRVRWWLRWRWQRCRERPTGLSHCCYEPTPYSSGWQPRQCHSLGASVQVSVPARHIRVAAHRQQCAHLVAAVAKSGMVRD